MNASEQIDDLISKLTDWRGTTLANTRKLIHEADPGIGEEWKWMGSPVWSHDGIICVATVLKDKVKLTFSNGAHLADPDKIFNNGLSGKQWRAIDMPKDYKLNESGFKTLIRAGIGYNQSKLKSVKKPVTGRGTAQKKPAK